MINDRHLDSLVDKAIKRPPETCYFYDQESGRGHLGVSCDKDAVVRVPRMVMRVGDTYLPVCQQCLETLVKWREQAQLGESYYGPVGTQPKNNTRPLNSGW